MRRTVFTVPIAILGMILLGGAAIESSQARELKGQDLGRQEAAEIKGLGQKGSTLPDAPPNPQCPIGSSQSGPIDIRTFAKKCKVNGKEGSQMCISKMVHCGVGWVSRIPSPRKIVVRV